MHPSSLYVSPRPAAPSFAWRQSDAGRVAGGGGLSGGGYGGNMPPQYVLAAPFASAAGAPQLPPPSSSAVLVMCPAPQTQPQSQPHHLPTAIMVTTPCHPPHPHNPQGHLQQVAFASPMMVQMMPPGARFAVSQGQHLTQQQQHVTQQPQPAESRIFWGNSSTLLDNRVVSGPGPHQSMPCGAAASSSSPAYVVSQPAGAPYLQLTNCSMSGAATTAPAARMTVPTSTAAASNVVTPPRSPLGRLSRSVSAASTNNPGDASAARPHLSVNALKTTTARGTNPMDLLANVATAVDGRDSFSHPAPSSPSPSSAASPRAAAVALVGGAGGDAAAPPGRFLLQPPETDFDDDSQPRRVSLEHSTAAPSPDESPILLGGSCRGGGGNLLGPSCASAETDQPTLLDVVVPSSRHQQSGAESAADAEAAEQNNVGNEFYRKVIQLNLVRYASGSNSHEKNFVVRSVVDSFERHGTRFLKRRGAPSRFVPVSRKAAYRHVKRSLASALERVEQIRDEARRRASISKAAAEAAAEAAAAARARVMTAPVPAPAQNGRKPHPPKPRLANPVPFGEQARPTSAPRTPEQSGPRPLHPHPNDVVFGRGNNIANHPGNLLFRQFVLQEKAVYGTAPRQAKAVIAGRVVDKVLRLNPPGRFLEMGDDGRYYDVDPHRVFEKTCQACRERKWSRASAARSTSGPPPLAASAASGLSGGHGNNGRVSPYEWYGAMGGGGAAGQGR